MGGFYCTGLHRNCISPSQSKLNGFFEGVADVVVANICIAQRFKCYNSCLGLSLQISLLASLNVLIITCFLGISHNNKPL